MKSAFARLRICGFWAALLAGYISGPSHDVCCGAFIDHNDITYVYPNAGIPEQGNSKVPRSDFSEDNADSTGDELADGVIPTMFSEANPDPAWVGFTEFGGSGSGTDTGEVQPRMEVSLSAVYDLTSLSVTYQTGGLHGRLGPTRLEISYSTDNGLSVPSVPDIVYTSFNRTNNNTAFVATAVIGLAGTEVSDVRLDFFQGNKGQQAAWVFLSEVAFEGQLIRSYPSVIDIQVSAPLWFDGAQSIPTGADGQALPLPWTTAQEISVVFSKEVTIGPNSVSLVSPDGTELSLSGPTTGSGTDPGTFVATWVLTDPLRAGRYNLRLSDTITDLVGTPLDGEWTNGESTVSGDGFPGGDFMFALNVLPGDANQDRAVNMLDAIRVRDHLRTWVGHPNYSRFSDIDADGLIDRSDLVNAVRHGWTRLPSGPAASTAVPEPSTLALVLLALAVALHSGAWRRRQSVLGM